jgi:cadmium resistance protein CadD (predicted permease)
VLGQYIGIGGLASVSLVAATIALVIPRAYIGLLGLAPIAIGVKALVERHDKDPPEQRKAPARGSAARVLSVSAITIANGGDNIGVYTPLFATQTLVATCVTLIVFAAMTAFWCAFGYWLVRHPRAGSPIRRWGPQALPFVLIGLGVLVLYRADTFSALLRFLS